MHLVGSKDSLFKKRLTKVFLIFLLVIVIILAFEAGFYWWLVKKGTFSSKEISSPPKVTETKLTESEKENFLSWLPKDHKTGLGAVSLDGDRINVWGTLVEINQNDLILEVNEEMVRVFTDDGTKYSSRPKNIISFDNPAEVLKSFSRKSLVLGKELEIVANLGKTDGSEFVITAIIVSVLE